jgi:predicted transcriptional regulator
MMNDATPITQLTSRIVAAYVQANVVGQSNLSQLIQDVGNALRSLGKNQLPQELEKKAVPAVPIKKSVTEDHIVCLEDGLRFTSLKRHLLTSHNLTPAAYRERWKLPPDYPMVATGYAKSRSALAKQSGLGRTNPMVPEVDASAQQDAPALEEQMVPTMVEQPAPGAE